MVSTIIVRCSGCKARIKAPTQLLGERRACPGCNTLFVVRPQAPPDLGPTFVNEQPPLGTWYADLRAIS